MRRRGIAWAMLGTCACAFVWYCSPNDGGNSNDAGADAEGGLPAQGFNLSLVPGHINADPGDSDTITIQIARAASFTDDIFFTVASAPPGVNASLPLVTVTPKTTSMTMSVGIAQDAGLGDLTLTISGANMTKTVVQTASLGIHVGTLVHVGAGEFTVPSFANALVVEAWGASGGGGSGCTNCGYQGSNLFGSFGGPGGYASATLAFAPGTQLVAIVGSGGGGGGRGSCANTWGGGGGGGFTALQVKGNATFLIIAGGGGGGVAGSDGVFAGTGGGTSGNLNFTASYCDGHGGTQTQGGDAGDGFNCDPLGSAGSAYQGGDAFTIACGDAGRGAGGSPGGGSGGVEGHDAASPFRLGGGGGGGGYFGGGGGSGGAGGGGSGFLSTDAGGLFAGDQTGPPGYGDNKDYIAYCGDAGVGGNGGTLDGGPGEPGNPGCIVVRLTKP